MQKITDVHVFLLQFLPIFTDFTTTCTDLYSFFQKFTTVTQKNNLPFTNLPTSG
jgi:hypothetical protein